MIDPRANLELCRDREVCIVGLGYVGLTLATIMAEIGFRVHGLETNDAALESIARGEPHFYEPGLHDRLSDCIESGRFTVSREMPDGISPSVFIITVGTPIDANGLARLDMVERVTRLLAERLTGTELIILRSTVKIGTTAKVVAPILAATGKGFDLAFCPERTLEGRALEELRYLPQIVGGLTEAATIRAAAMFQYLTPTVIRVSDPDTAEVIKLVDNASRDLFFGYANEVARICNHIGVNGSEVIRSGGLGYPRTKLPIPGLVGGPCLSKDSHILVESMGDSPELATLTGSARAINEGMTGEAVDFIDIYGALAGISPKPVISLLGLAFKGTPPTDDLRGSTIFPLIKQIRAAFPECTLRGFDPVIDAPRIAALDLTPAASLEDAFDGADIAIIHNNHRLFAEMPLGRLSRRMHKPSLVYDFWNNFEPELTSSPDTAYVGFGSHGVALRKLRAALNSAVSITGSRLGT